jgi:hypothetical protein
MAYFRRKYIDVLAGATKLPFDVLGVIVKYFTPKKIAHDDLRYRMLEDMPIKRYIIRPSYDWNDEDDEFIEVFLPIRELDDDVFIGIKLEYNISTGSFTEEKIVTGINCFDSIDEHTVVDDDGVVVLQEVVVED